MPPNALRYYRSLIWYHLIREDARERRSGTVDVPSNSVVLGKHISTASRTIWKYDTRLSETSPVERIRYKASKTQRVIYHAHIISEVGFAFSTGRAAKSRSLPPRNETRPRLATRDDDRPYFRGLCKPPRFEFITGDKSDPDVFSSLRLPLRFALSWRPRSRDRLLQSGDVWGRMLRR